MSNNQISEVLATANLTAIEEAIRGIRGHLPFLQSMTAKERKKLLKLGDDRLALDEDAHALMLDHPTLVPSYVNLPELEKDRVLRQQLDGIRLELTALLDDVTSTEMVTGAEMLQVYLAFYSNAKEAAKRGVSGAETVVNVLQKYFNRSARPVSDEEVPKNA